MLLGTFIHADVLQLLPPYGVYGIGDLDASTGTADQGFPSAATCQLDFLAAFIPMSVGQGEAFRVGLA